MMEFHTDKRLGFVSLRLGPLFAIFWRGPGWCAHVSIRFGLQSHGFSFGPGVPSRLPRFSHTKFERA
jgi:hypothetical protein